MGKLSRIANSSLLGVGAVFSTLMLLLSSCGSPKSTEPTSRAEGEPKVDESLVDVAQGDLSKHGGTPTVRKSYRREQDNPLTSNNESNDQPLGHFGTSTIMVTNVNSGNSYAVDADVNGGEVERIYFQKGGWVDFDTSEIDEHGVGTGTDERGNEWEFNGFEDGTSAPSTEVNVEE